MWKNEEDVVKVDCKCPCAEKIPVIELDFIYAQRNRGPNLPSLKISQVDVKVSKKLQESASRKVNLNRILTIHVGNAKSKLIQLLSFVNLFCISGNIYAGLHNVN